MGFFCFFFSLFPWFLFPRVMLQTASIFLALTYWHLLFNQLFPLAAADFHLVLCFSPCVILPSFWMFQRSGLSPFFFELCISLFTFSFNLCPDFMSSLFQNSFSFLLYWALFSLRHVVSPFQWMHSILPSASSCILHPTLFGLVLNFFQICASFFSFLLPSNFLHLCIISCHFLLKIKLKKWGVYVCLRVVLTFFSPSQTSFITKKHKFLIYFLSY